MNQHQGSKVNKGMNDAGRWLLGIALILLGCAAVLHGCMQPAEAAAPKSEVEIERVRGATVHDSEAHYFEVQVFVMSERNFRKTIEQPTSTGAKAKREGIEIVQRLRSKNPTEVYRLMQHVVVPRK